MATERVSILIETQFSGAGAQQATRSLAGVEAQAKRSRVSMQSFASGLRSVTEGFASFAPAVAIFKKAFDFAKAGAEIEKTTQSFKALTNSIGGTSEALIEQLRTATGGAVADLSLMQGANQFMAMGLATTTAEVATLTETAVKLGSAFGTDASTSIENFSLLLANQSIPRLDTFGISSSKVRERIAELTTGIGAVDRETAFMMATMEEAEKTIGKLGLEGATTADAYTILSTNVENLTNDFKVWLAEGLNPAVSAIANQYAPALRAMIDANLEGAKSTADLVGLLEKLESFGLITRVLTGTNEEFLESESRVRIELAKTVDTYEEFERIIAKTQGLRVIERANMSEINFLLEEFNTAQRQATEAVQAEMKAQTEVSEKMERLNTIQQRATELRREATQAEYDNIEAVMERLDVIDPLLRATELQAERMARLGEVARENSLIFEETSQAMGGSFFDALMGAVEPIDNTTMALFNQAQQAGAGAGELVALAIATGEFTEAQIESALKASALQTKIEELGQAVADGTVSVSDAIAELNDFKATVEGLPRSHILTIDIQTTGQFPTLPSGTQTQTAQAFQRGGFTGAGSTSEVAGVVHRGEFVMPANVVAQSGMREFLEALRNQSGISNNFNMTVNTGAHSSTVQRDFAMMQSLASMQ